MEIFGLSIKRASAPRRNYRARGEYKIVDSKSYTIEPSSTERRTEDEILDESKRLRLLDITRNLVRNSATFSTIVGNLTTRVVGDCGGKVVIEDQATADALFGPFAKWTRNAGFFEGETFNRLLKRVLREVIVGGDCVLVFDSGLVENSGRVLLFEAEEIVGVDPAVVVEKYGAGAWQSHGKVYSANGRHIGTIVSRAQRGATAADPTKCWFLRRDPNGSWLDCGWYQPQNSYRDGRGVSQAASIVGTIHQLEDLVTSELMAARKNSQTFCWLTQKATDDVSEPSAFDSSDLEGMSDDELKEAAKQEAEAVKTVTLSKARENSVAYEALPEGFDPHLVDTKHPNQNVIAMVDWLCNRCVSVLGLSKVFACGNPTNADWRASQLYSQPAIVEFQKDLEAVCDWAFRRFAEWLGVKEPAHVAWRWRGLDELDEVAHANAVEKNLRLMMTNYRELLGPDWKAKLEQSAEEISWLKEKGLPLAFYDMKSGGQGVGADAVTNV